MLMDLFFNAAAVARKQRVHFNSFMLNVHDSKFKHQSVNVTVLLQMEWDNL